MEQNNTSGKKRKREGFLSGLIYGLIPHISCIAFIIFSVLGVTAATTFFKPFLLNPYFFYILIGISLFFATISAIFYFKKQGFLIFERKKGGLEINFSPTVFKRKWKYLLTLYGTTISINLLLFMLIFPIAANISSGVGLTAAILGAFGGGKETQLQNSGASITMRVDIPCPGHAPLIIGELKKIEGVESVKFSFPNQFDVGYDPEKTSKEQMLSLEVFKTYKATIVAENENQNTGTIENTVQSQSRSNTRSCCVAGVNGRGCGCGCGR